MPSSYLAAMSLVFLGWVTYKVTHLDRLPATSGGYQLKELLTQIRSANISDEERVEAAKNCLERYSLECVTAIVVRAMRGTSSTEFRHRLALSLAERSLMLDPEEKKELHKILKNGLGRRTLEQRTFFLHATQNLSIKWIAKEILPALQSGDKTLQGIALQILRKTEDLNLVESLNRDIPHITMDQSPSFVGELLDLYLDRAINPKAIEPFIQKLSRGKRGSSVQSVALLRLGRLLKHEYSEKSWKILLDTLRSKMWPTRLAALRALENLRNSHSIQPIVAQLQYESGRMAHEISLTLERLTGQSIRGAKNWKKWLEEQRGDFKVLTEEEYQALRERKKLNARSSTESRSVPSSFFSLPIVSVRVLFIIDRSSSMGVKLDDCDEPSGLTRMELTRRELIHALESMYERDQAKDRKTSQFNLIWFNGDVDQLFRKSADLTKTALRRAKRKVNSLVALGSTDLYQALKDGFEHHNIDTIYLLADGTGSKFPNFESFGEAISDLNQGRNIEINTITICQPDHPLMKMLAEMSGGKHVDFQP